MLCNELEPLQIEGVQHTYSFHRSVFAPVESNMYVLVEGTEAIVVDSNINEEAIQMLKDKGVRKVHLFLTHEHYDHSHGVVCMKEHFDVTLYCHQNSEGKLNTKKNCSPKLVAFVCSVKDENDGGHRYEDFKKNFIEYELHPDVCFEDGSNFEIAGHSIRIIHTPGHTPGSSFIVMDEELAFTGDTMIEGNKIITTFRGGNKDELKNTLPILKALPDDLWIMPGHGDPFKKKQFNFDIYNV